MRSKDRRLIITHDFTVGHEYQIKVSAVDSTGRIQKVEDSPTSSLVIRGKTATPAPTSGPAATARFTTIFISWTNPLDADYKEMEVWGTTVNDFGMALPLGRTSSTEFVHNVGLPNRTWWYWLRAYNTSGKGSTYNPATMTTTITATTEQIADVYLGSLNADKITAGTITGSTLQTAASGQRVVIAAADNTLRFHTVAESNVILIDDNVSGSLPGIKISSDAGGVVQVLDSSTLNDFCLIAAENLGGRVAARTSGSYSGSFQRNRAGAGADGVVRIDKMHTSDSGPYLSCWFNIATKEFEVKNNGAVNTVSGYQVNDVEIVDSSRNFKNITAFTQQTLSHSAAGTTVFNVIGTSNAQWGPAIKMTHSRGTDVAGQDGDIVSYLFFQGYNDKAVTPELISYGSIITTIVDASDTTEDSKTEHSIMVNGGIVKALTLDASGATVIGAVDATTYKVNGAAGANFDGAVTNLTVVDGLVTAAS